MDDTNTNVPLDPISLPFSSFPRIANMYDVVSIMFTVIFLLWAVYTVVSIYHWLRYGHNSWIAAPAIGLHLLVSASLMVFATSGFN